MGFHERWIGWIMRCITTVSYSIIINGEAYGSIVPSRELRQGDPLFSYLFLLCKEAFSTLIEEANNTTALTGISICRGSLKVTHLFFADDSLLFYKAENMECSKMVEILK